jgi:hypothetical protein
MSYERRSRSYGAFDVNRSRRTWYSPTGVRISHAVVAAWFCALTGCGYFGFEADESLLVSNDAMVDAPGSDSGASDASTSDAGSARGLGALCTFGMVTVILDEDATDAAAGAMLASAVASGCSTSPVVQMLQESTPGLLDPTTHAPLFGSATLGVVGGSAYYQDVMAYLGTSTTPIVATESPTHWTIARRGGAELVSRLRDTLDDTHDIAVIEVSRDLASGSVVLSAFGLYYRGTLAAAYYFANSLAPTIATDGREFYVIEWTNGDADVNPSSGDTFAVLAMGP